MCFFKCAACLRTAISSLGGITGALCSVGRDHWSPVLHGHGSCPAGRTHWLHRDDADGQISVLERHYCVFGHYPLQINMISRSKIQAEVGHPLSIVFPWNLATSLSGALSDPCSYDACQPFSSFFSVHAVGRVSAAAAPFARSGSLLYPAELETWNFAYSWVLEAVLHCKIFKKLKLHLLVFMMRGREAHSPSDILVPIVSRLCQNHL